MDIYGNAPGVSDQDLTTNSDVIFASTTVQKTCFVNGTAPATPSSGDTCLYAKLDKKLYYKDDAGNETLLGGSSSAGGSGFWTFTTSLSGDPLALNVGFNNSTSALVTGIQVAKTDFNSVNQSVMLATMRGGDQFHFNTGTSAKLYTVSAAGVDQGTWFEFVVTFEAEDSVVNYLNGEGLDVSIILQNPWDQTLNTTDSPTFNSITLTTDITANGQVNINHTAAAAGDHALEIDHNANGFGDNKALDIVYTTGAAAVNSEDAAILVNIDQSLALGGEVNALSVLCTEGLGSCVAVFAGAGVAPLHHNVGAFIDPSIGTVDINGSATAVGALAGVNLFASDNDYLILADAQLFTQAEFLLTQVAEEKKDMSLDFEFSTGTGPLAWTVFSPTDGTNGMRNTGVITWVAADTPGWITDGGVYKIRITRRRNGSVVVPQAENNGIKLTVGVLEYGWNKDGELLAAEVDVASYKDNGTTGVLARTGFLGTDNIVISSEAIGTYALQGVSSSNILMGLNSGKLISTGSNNLCLGGLAGATNATGFNSTYLGGTAAGRYQKGTGNVGVGTLALQGDVGGTSVGTFNTACGYSSLSGITTGSSNVGVGGEAGKVITTGANNVAIGTLSDCAATLSNQIAIGAGAVSIAANTCMIGSSVTTAIMPNAGATCSLGTTANPFGALVLSGTAKIGGYTLPSTDGTEWQRLKTNGAGFVAWTGFNVVGLGDGQLLTLDTNGAVTIASSFHAIDTFGGAGTDNLDNIYFPFTNIIGTTLIITIANLLRTITVRNNGGGAGNIRLAGGADLTLTTANSTLTLIRRTNNVWVETCRSIV